MPLADLTAVSNLALDYLGEPYLTAYATDTTVAAQACRLHLPQCIETVLEGHVWSFATRCSQLTAAAVESTTAQIDVYPGGENNGILLVAQTPGPSGNEISLMIAGPDYLATEIVVDVTGPSISVVPPGVPTEIVVSGSLTISSIAQTIPTLEYAGTVNGKAAWGVGGSTASSYVIFWESENDRWIFRAFENSWSSDEIENSPLNCDGTWVPLEVTGGGNPGFSGTLANTAAEVIDALTADSSAALLVTAVNSQGHDGSGTVSAVSATYLEGGSSTSTVYAPAYGSGFNLPADCLRVLKIDTADIDVPRNDFEIQGRYLLLAEELAEAPVIHYITSDPPVDEWPTTFTDAVAFLLASRLAPKLAKDIQLAGDLLQKHELALGKARSKDTRETRSKENFGPRQLAARSGLVRARFATGGLPWAPATGVTVIGETASVDLDGLFTENL